MSRAMTKTPEKWCDYIGTALKKTASATLETAERIAKYKENSEPDEFNKNMLEWFNFSPSHLSYWSKIQENQLRFADNVSAIPSSSRALYELAGIEDDLWDELVELGKINPAMTIEGVKSLKAKGGVVKQLAEKYGDAENFLDIMQHAGEIRQASTSVADFKKTFAKWLKANPPEYDVPEEVVEEADVEPSEQDLKDIAETLEPIVGELVLDDVPETSKTVRIKCLAAFGIFTDKPIVDEDVLTFLDKLAGNNESLIAAVKTLEGK